MKLYAGKFDELRNYYQKNERAVRHAYQNAFGSRFPAVDEVCERFILKKAFSGEGIFEKPLPLNIPITFATYLINPGLSGECKKGDELLTAFMFLEESSKCTYKKPTNYLLQFNHFLLFALQPVPMDVMEMELTHIIRKRGEVNLRGLKRAINSILTAEVTTEDKVDLIRKTACFFLIQRQRIQLEKTINYLFMSHFIPKEELRTGGIGPQQPEIQKIHVRELGIDIPNIEGSLYYSDDLHKTLEQGIDWHKISLAHLDTHIDGILTFFREARYSKHIYADLKKMFGSSIQA